MKRLKGIIALIFSLALFSLTACKDNNDVEKRPPEKKSEVEVFFENGRVDTLTVMHKGDLGISGNGNCLWHGDFVKHKLNICGVNYFNILKTVKKEKNGGSRKYRKIE